MARREWGCPNKDPGGQDQESETRLLSAFLGIPPGTWYRVGAGKLMKEPRKLKSLLANSFLTYVGKLKSRAASWRKKF